jgi:4-hydroxy-tetrahydrodipicolinate synthase
VTKRLDGDAKGVFVISATPFTETGEIDWYSIDSLIEFYLATGVHGLTILGMMGEAQKLNDEESVRVTRAILRRVADRIPVIVGVSHAANASLASLAKLSVDAGACGVMVTPLPGLNETQVLAYFADIMSMLGDDIPVVYQDYPQATRAHISVQSFCKLVDSHLNLVMLKHEDCPGLKKLAQIRRACNGDTHRRISITVGNGALYLPQEMRRGADGIMTGFAFPEMLVSVYELFAAGRLEEAEDLFDIYLPLVRYEQQPGFGLAVRKEILRRRGAIRSAAVRAPGPKLDDDDVREIAHLIGRLEARLAERATPPQLAVA